MALVPFPGPQSEAVQVPPDEEEELTGGKMSFLEHLDELRKRIVRACLAIAGGVLVGFFFIDKIFKFLMAPARSALPPGASLIYTQPGEAFNLYITVSLIAGVVIAAPFIMYQIWMFIAPGLYSNEKRWAIPFVVLTTLGFITGAAFNHYVAFPFIMMFFASFNSIDLKFMPKLEDVFGLYTKMLIGIGIVFQMPTVVYFLAKMRVVTARFLARNFKYAFLLIFVVAAVITPTGDPMTQTIFAAPMVALYGLSIIVAWVVGPKRLKDEA
jgi:sec-independent protein translocase protein TatC